MTIFIIIWATWFLSEVFLNRICRSGTGDLQNKDEGTIKLIWIVIGIANTLGILISVFVKWPIGHDPLVPYFGLALLVIGMLIRFISIRTLGKYFTVDVTIRADHKLKRDGLYRYVRHPSYCGSILSFIGFGISLNNLLSLLIISIMVTAAMIKRIAVEEKILMEQFGEEYQEYMLRTYRLVPWIY